MLIIFLIKKNLCQLLQKSTGADTVIELQLLTLLLMLSTAALYSGD